MSATKRKLTAAEKRAKCERKEKRKQEFMTIFVNGKQKSVRREPLIDGMPVDEFIAANADPIWLQQNEMWELMPPFDDSPGTDADDGYSSSSSSSSPSQSY